MSKLLLSDPRSSTPSSSLPCSLKTGIDPLSNQRTLKLGKRGKDAEDQLPLRRGGFYLFGETFQGNPTVLQKLDRDNKLLHRPCQTIKLPHNNDVTSPGKFESLCKFETVCFRTGSCL